MPPTQEAEAPEAPEPVPEPEPQPEPEPTPEPEPEPTPGPGNLGVIVEAPIEVRDAARREVDVRLLSWDTQIDTLLGPEMFARGAFDGAVPSDVYLYGPEHELRLGVGQDGRAVPIRVPVGKAYALGDDGVGPTASFRVARTVAGDEALALMVDGIISTVSVEFARIPGGTRTESRGGRRVSIHTRARLVGATPTHRPAYDRAAVLAVRSKESPAMPPEAVDATATPAAAQTGVIVHPLTEDVLTRALGGLAVQFGKPIDEIVARLDRIEETGRAQFSIPAAGAPAIDVPGSGTWMNVIVRMLTGERIAESETRALADLITTDNIGVVPDQYLSEMVGIIDPARPFLDSTRKIPENGTGMSLVLPKINTRPTTGVQAAEKDEVVSTATAIGTASFDAVTVAGAGDISIQLLKRSSPSFLSLYLELLFEAYATDADDLAVDALLAAVGIHAGGALDPEDLSLGAAWAFGVAVSRRLAPTHIWLSSEAVGRFIDAKASATNAPLYSNLEANFQAASGTGGRISGLIPVHVPALDDEAVDIIVGPRNGFLWAEDGTYTLQVDVPAKAGRDVAIVGMLWFAPVYPTAFTTFTLAAPGLLTAQSARATSPRAGGSTTAAKAPEAS